MNAFFYIDRYHLELEPRDSASRTVSRKKKPPGTNERTKRYMRYPSKM